MTATVRKHLVVFQCLDLWVQWVPEELLALLVYLALKVSKDTKASLVNQVHLVPWVHVVLLAPLARMVMMVNMAKLVAPVNVVLLVLRVLVVSLELLDFQESKDTEVSMAWMVLRVTLVQLALRVKLVLLVKMELLVQWVHVV